MSLDKSWFTFDYKLKPLAGFSDPHVRFPRVLPEKFIKAYTKKGDNVFDPFSGFGTTLTTAQKLGRNAYGIEFDEKKIPYIESRLESPSRIIHGSSLDIESFDLPLMDLCFTSPPYMRSFDKENPLSNYTKGGSYQDYLAGISSIYAQVKKIMKENAVVVVEIQNTVDSHHPMTPLAWDVGKEISKHLYFERDFIACDKRASIKEPFDQDTHSYCLLFRNKS